MVIPPVIIDKRNGNYKQRAIRLANARGYKKNRWRCSGLFSHPREKEISA
jgi:hypothetical protein